MPKNDLSRGNQCGFGTHGGRRLVQRDDHNKAEPKAKRRERPGPSWRDFDRTVRFGFVSRLLPRNYRPIYSAEEIQDAVSKLASDLSPWAEGVHRQTGNQPMALCILRGAFLFFADLLKALPCSVQPAFVRCQSYAAAEILRPEAGVKLSLDDLDARCRHVLVIDDICGSSKLLGVICYE